MYQEYDSEDQSAATNCTVVVGNGSGEFPDIPAALNSLGNNVAGKTVCVKNNKIYGQLNIKNKHGTASAPLMIVAHPANTGNKLPQFKDTSTPMVESTQYRGAIDIDSSSHIVLEGLEVAQSPSIGIDIVKSNNILVKGVIIHDNHTQVIRVGSSNTVTVDGCQVYNYKKYIVPLIAPEALFTGDSENIVFQNCKLWDNISKDGNGGVLATLRSTNVTFRNNEVHAPYVGPALHPDQSKNVLYENNVVINYCSTPAGGAGFYWLDEVYPKQGYRTQHGESITVRNNLIIGPARTGLSVGGCEKKGSPGDDRYMDGECVAKNIVLENNTVVGLIETPEKPSAAFRYSSSHDKAPQGLSIKNNIFHTIDTITQENSPGEQYFDGNIWSKTPYNTKPSKDSVVSNLDGVFSSGINLNSCVPVPANLDISKYINNYKTTTAYNGKGADVSKVGIKTTLPPVGTNNPTSVPSSTPAMTPTDITGNRCGKADTDGDGRFTIVDFVQFALAYGIGKNTCVDKDEDYGPCGGRDVNRDGKLSIQDFGEPRIGFAQRYYPKTSCAL